MANKPASVRRTDWGPEDDAIDLSFEVPVPLPCAVCGRPGCAGCVPGSDQASGVIAIVPWEGSGPFWARFWGTARASTYDAESFFAVMPTGDLSPAMRFAVLAELFAVLSMAVCLVPFAVLALPTLAIEVVRSPALRSAALRWALLGIPVLTGWMVAAHVGHGTALDLGARKLGASPDRRRAVRFGLYACGWDVMFGPLGVAVEVAAKGRSALLRIALLMARVPQQSTRAFLHGIYQLSPDEARRAQRTSVMSALAVAFVAGAIVLVVATLLFFL